MAEGGCLPPGADCTVSIRRRADDRGFSATACIPRISTSTLSLSQGRSLPHSRGQSAQPQNRPICARQHRSLRCSSAALNRSARLPGEGDRFVVTIGDGCRDGSAGSCRAIRRGPERGTTGPGKPASSQGASAQRLPRTTLPTHALHRNPASPGPVSDGCYRFATWTRLEPPWS